MASPLHWFRKNQKVLLGVFGVGLMFVFTISLGSGGGSLIDRLTGQGRGGGAANPTAVKWDGGKLTENQLDRLRTQRNLLRRFLAGVMQTARERGGQQRVSMLPLYSGDQSLLELEMLAGEAENMGLAVNDETVIDYLNQLTDGTIRPSEYGQILRDTTAGHLSEAALFPLLSREIKAQKVRGLVQSGSYPTSPVAAWDYYNRLNRLVKAEIMPILVDDYLGQVGQPNESEVVELFEKYKDQYPHPLSPDPGFRQRERRAFQYVKVNYDAILETEKASVTDEQIQKYYNDNKEQYLTQSEDDLTLDVGETETSPNDEGAGKTTTETEGTKTEGTKTEGTKTEGTKTEGTKTQAETAEEDPTPAPTAVPQEDSEASPQTSTDQPQDEGAGEEATASEDDPSSDAGEPETSEAETANNAQPAEERPVGESTEDPVTSVKPTTETPTTAEAPAETPTAEIATDEQLDVSDLDDLATYRELAEVADEIRQSIAAPLAQTKMKLLLVDVQNAMEKYWQDHTLWEMDAEKNPDLQPPPLPKFEALTDGRQAVMGQVELTDRIDVENYEIGQAFDISISAQGSVQRVSFGDVAYDPSMSIYKPQLFPTLDMATDRFVFWLTAIEAEYIPTLEQVREKVVEAWQRQQALQIAKREAERLVTKAKQANTKLMDCLADDKHTQFVDTGEISWVTAPLQEGATPQISQISGAEDAGPELREKLFRLTPGDVGYAPNMPKTKVYVFRVAEENPSLEVRREQFLQNGVGAPVLFLARRDSLISLSEWYRDLTERYHVDWQRDPRRDDNGEL